MENKTEDEIRKRWEVEAKEKAERDEGAQQRPKKRVRAIEYNKGNDLGEGLNDEELEETLRPSPRPKANAARKKATARAASSKAKNRLTEMMDEGIILGIDRDIRSWGT
jgi:hypothetical protein